MADDVARLGLAVDSSQVKTGTQDLKDFSSAAGNAGNAADTLGAKTKTSVGVFGDMSKGIAAVNTAAKDSSGTVAQMGAAINAALAKNVVSFDAMRKGISDANSAAKQFSQGAESAAKGTEAAASAATKLANAHAGISAQGQTAFHAVRSFFEQVSLGVPITQAATSQLNHLSFAATGAGGITGAFKEAAGVVGGLVTSINPVIAATVVLTAAASALALQYDKVSVAAQKAISGAGARTGTTVTDLNAFVDKNTPSILSGTSLSQKESRALGEGLTQTGDIVISKLNSMSAAVVGFSNQTGQSMDESVKAFVKMGGDPVKAMDELSGVFGPFSQGTRTLVQDMVAAGDKTLAWNAILNELGPTAKGTADNLTFAEKSTRGFINFLQTAPKPTGLEKQLEDIRQQLNGAIEAAEQFAEHGIAPPPEVSNSVEALSRQFENLQGRQQAVIDLKASASFNDLADKARLATEALTPQISQLDQVRQKIQDLNRAKAEGATSRYGAEADRASLVAAQNLEQSLVQSQAQAARYNDRVKEISASWGDVGQQTALSLQAAQNQLPVLEAVGGAAKMAAQYTADYKNYMDQGKTSTEATALASSNLAAAQAQVESAARQTLASLQDQAGVAAAVTGQQRISAQFQATFNSLVRQGVSLETASAVAAQEASNAHAAASASVMRQVESLKDQVAMIQAARDGTEAQTAAAIAYKNAIDAGADRTAAAALEAQTLALYMERAGVAAKQLAGSVVSVAGSTNAGANTGVNGGTDGFSNSATYTWFTPGRQMDFTTAPGYGQLPTTYAFSRGGVNYTTPSYAAALLGSYDTPVTSQAYIQDLLNQKNGLIGGIDGAIQALQSSATNPSILGPKVTDATSSLQQLYSAKNDAAPDNATKIANDQQFLAWLQTQPQTIENLQAISTLTSEIQSLAKSVDSNTGATSANTDALSPYYSQDPRTSHIGFRSQGMATGGYVDVPGSPSANDNMIAMIPVASGERISVDPMSSKRGVGGGTEINLGGVHVTVMGGATKSDANAIGRTVYQAMQQASRQLAAASL